MNAPEFQIPYTPDGDGKVLVAVHEMNRLIANDKMLKHLIERCTYLEDGRIAGKINEGDCWMADDEDRDNLPLTSYLEIRVRGEHVPDFWPIEMSLEEARNHSEQVKRGCVTWTVTVENIPDGDDYEERKLAEVRP